MINLPSILTGLIGIAMAALMGAMIILGPDGFEREVASPSVQELDPVLPQRCLTMPDGARLCDAPGTPHPPQETRP